MAIFTKSSVVRAVIFVFIFVLLAVSGTVYRHPVPTAVPRYITFNHEMRRLLGRAERDIFRTSVTLRDVGLVTDTLQETGEITPSPQVVVVYNRIASVQQRLSGPTELILALSPVLNL